MSSFRVLRVPLARDGFLQPVCGLPAGLEGGFRVIMRPTGLSSNLLVMFTLHPPGGIVSGVPTLELPARYEMPALWDQKVEALFLESLRACFLFFRGITGERAEPRWNRMAGPGRLPAVTTSLPSPDERAVQRQTS